MNTKTNEEDIEQITKMLQDIERLVIGNHNFLEVSEILEQIRTFVIDIFQVDV